ncbi:MAG: ATP-binding protein [Nitrospirota bacterium]|nr:MAG: ATP-binding protein [Nitrospirota bacterium]
MSPANTPVQTNPFPGLRPFREDEEYLFFGRESQVDAMVDKLATTRFLAVVGYSGSGKSSLVNCGLRPALHGGLMTRAGTTWRIAQFRPGSDPIRALARALAQDRVLFRDYQAGGLTLAEIVDTTLRMSKLGLMDIYEQAKLGEGVNLLLVVDQFEELFRYRQLGAGQQENVSGVSEAAAAFVKLLLEAKAQTTYPIYVVLTMRSDFLGDCPQFPGLAEAINAGQYLVPRMTRDERRAAISGPVGVRGAEMAPVLLTRLVNDVGDNPDQLSILQHALNRTWAAWQKEDGVKGPLDLRHYEAIGTMAHALDQHAEQAYLELDTARKRQICEKVFKALTDKATDPRGVRRPTTMGTLCALTEATTAEVTEVIDVFRQPSRSFLMPPDGELLEAETVIDISHESLMRVWERLNRWADEEARSARMYRRLAETSILHREGNAALWRDPDLRMALRWRKQGKPNETWGKRYNPEFSNAMAFLRKSERWKFLKRTALSIVIASLVGTVGLKAGYKMYADYADAQTKVDEALHAAETEKQAAEAAQAAQEDAKEDLKATLEEIKVKLAQIGGEDKQELQKKIESVKQEVQAVEKRIEKVSSAPPTEALLASIDSPPAVAADQKAGKAPSPTKILSPEGENFLACANVSNLEPSSCEILHPGKVYLFARVVTLEMEETLELRWFDGTGKNFSSRPLKVKRSSRGYRTYTWKMLGAGKYTACLFDQSNRQVSSCLKFKVTTPPNPLMTS